MKKIKIQQIGKFFEEEHESLIRFAVFTLDKRIKQVSPVHTGRFRMNWQLAENKRSAPIQGGPFNPNKSAIIPPFVSCATSQKVIPAFGNKSEIGINAEPMIPNAC